VKITASESATSAANVQESTLQNWWHAATKNIFIKIIWTMKFSATTSNALISPFRKPRQLKLWERVESKTDVHRNPFSCVDVLNVRSSTALASFNSFVDYCLKDQELHWQTAAVNLNCHKLLIYKVLVSWAS
jgi:hypothetical protein